MGDRPAASHEIAAYAVDYRPPLSPEGEDGTPKQVYKDVIEERFTPTGVKHHWYSRDKYAGALLFNLCAFLLPALYATLSKMWIADLDSSLVATMDSYTYASIVAEVINEGLPRAVWSTTADRTNLAIETRLAQILTLIAIQNVFGIILFISFLAAAPAFVSGFVPGVVRATSVQYIRISSGSLLASTIETAVSLGTRALDHPDVPLLISTIKTATQIILELAMISKIHAPGFFPTIQKSAAIRLVCDLLGAFAGLIYFAWVMSRKYPEVLWNRRSWSSWPALRTLIKPGKWTFTESAVRNAIYLYLVHGVVAMGSVYATAWGVFNTIRWGLIMVPVQSLEATANAFVGHRWGAWKSLGKDRATWRDIRDIIKPALQSVLIALIFEVPICIALSLAGAEKFAMYLGGNKAVAETTAMMWRTMDWMYICYAISTCLATILLATKASYYLSQSLVSNLCYCLPWAIVIGRTHITPDTAWWWHKWVFGGSLVFSLVDILVFVGIWAAVLRSGSLRNLFVRRQRQRLPSV